MSEPGLGRRITGRIVRLQWLMLAAYAAVVIATFAALSEFALRRSLAESADVIESLLTLYADPEGQPTSVAPSMLADQLLTMSERFLITRAVSGASGERTVYYLSPNMPAKAVRPPPGATPEEVRAIVIHAITAGGRWRLRVLHRQKGDFDIFVAGSRGPAALAVAALGVVALVLLPMAALLARRATERAVTAALVPLVRVVADTKTVGPSDLARRIQAETGIQEVSEIATEINRLLDRVERSYRALEQFTADASHELRTPLTHLRAQAHWGLAEHRTTAEMHEALSAISHEVDQTTKMIEDLLLLARGENRQLPMAPAPFAVREVVTDLEEIAHAMVSDRDIAIVISTGGEGWAFGDRDRTRQILLNLLTNAVRYTERGRIEFGFHHEEDMVGVSVRDTGPGIAPEHLDRIFDRFYRAERSRSRRYGGVGLGLTIARLLAELQGGHISVQSELGRGSTFTVWLPGTAGREPGRETGAPRDPQAQHDSSGARRSQRSSPRIY
jgi:signal transduction histidine kinase